MPLKSALTLLRVKTVWFSILKLQNCQTAPIKITAAASQLSSSPPVLSILRTLVCCTIPFSFSHQRKPVLKGCSSFSSSFQESDCVGVVTIHIAWGNCTKHWKSLRDSITFSQAMFEHRYTRHFSELVLAKKVSVVVYGPSFTAPFTI